MSWPADLYLEAVDQHRGWFQVSLINGVATRGRAPFRAVLTHGLILDESGHKMSKSLGNVVSPETILEKHGADVLRLLFASVDSTADIRFSSALVEPVSESYKKVRNTLRFLLGNLSGFDPATHAVDEGDILELDRFALERLRAVSAEARAAYADFAWPRVYRTLVVYLTSDVSAFYAHVLKDRLYCEAAAGVPRRSAQTVLLEIARECCQLLAPILCFTSDEVWEQLPSWSGKPASVHEDSWRTLPSADEQRLRDWGVIFGVRDEVLKALEVARAAGLIGDPLEAEVQLCLPKTASSVPLTRPSLLQDVLVVSAVRYVAAGTAPPAGARALERLEGGWVAVSRSPATKCPRCWQYRSDGGRLPGHPACCARCAEVVLSLGVDVEPA